MGDELRRALDFAVAKEKEAEAFYKEWAGRAKDPTVKGLLAELAATERGHMEILSRVRPDEMVAKGEEKIADLTLSDLLVEVKASAGMSLQQAMVVAMKREEASVALYERLAKLGGETQSLFRALANEERKHKVRLETEYDERILTDN